MCESSEDDVKKLLKMQTKQEENAVHDDKKSIAISNLDHKTTKNDITDFFKSCGKIKDIFVKQNSNKNIPAKAYVEFEVQKSVEIALMLNKKVLKGKTVYVAKKQAKRIANKNTRYNAKAKTARKM